VAKELRAESRSTNLRLASGLVATWGLYQILTGLYFIFFRPSFLPEDLRALNTTMESVSGAAPGIEAWLQLVFAVLGGQMAAGGILVMCGAVRLMQDCRWRRLEVWAYGTAGLFSVVLMSAVNFALASDFRWLLVLPVLLWLISVIVLGRSALGTASRIKTRTAPPPRS
jgi:hypothetical protein